MRPRNPNTAILVWFERIEYACLALVILISATDFVAWLMPGPGWTVLSTWLPMQPMSATSALLSALSLMFLGTGRTNWRRLVSPMLAGVVLLLAALILLNYSLPNLPDSVVDFIRSNNLSFPAGMTPQSAGTFALLGLTMLAMTAENRVTIWLSDVLALCLCMASLTLVSGYLYGKWSIFGTPVPVATLRGTLLCLSLLTLLTVLRRAENGIFSIYTGSGHGGKLARVLSPILLVAPFLREASRARIIGVGKMPPHYVTALLASSASILSIALLLYLVWRINSMESEIHALALRDELTGLNNLRGFKLLAGQAMRLAQRSKVPFSVMYVDLDGLKPINDSLGHHVGSQYISEAAETLRETCRETDVLGRIGGDEFAVAGQFSRRAMAAVAQRLKENCARKNLLEDRQYVLGLSIGHATRDETNKLTLDELMATADEAMYDAKRLKKDNQGLQASDALQKDQKLPL